MTQTTVLEQENTLKPSFFDVRRFLGAIQGYYSHFAGRQASLISCPVCGCTFNHLQVNGCHFPKDEHGDENYYPHWEGRGDAVVIAYQCEEGHDWNFVMGFHKGSYWTYGEVGND